ncbi:MAG TPA: thioredoxin domain-containing protein [Cytophagaceae bacterium]|jgi:thioredoxin
MKISSYFVILFLNLAIVAQSNGQAAKATTKGVSKLSPTEFNNKINLLPSLSILDVRTAEEFASGHLSGAKNINWNDTSFLSQVAKMDKSRPVFVYCLSGGRSAEAAFKLRALKFKEVYELDGGIMKWRAAGLHEIKDTVIAHDGMSRKDFDHLVKQDSVVLIDFYATWCSHCKKLAPELDELGKKLGSKLKIIKIDFDKNQALAKELKVEGLPKLFLYKNNVQTWSHMGSVSQEEIEEQLKTAAP